MVSTFCAFPLSSFRGRFKKMAFRGELPEERTGCAELTDEQYEDWKRLRQTIWEEATSRDVAEQRRERILHYANKFLPDFKEEPELAVEHAKRFVDALYGDTT